MKKVTIDKKTGRVRVQTEVTGPSKTQQHFRDQVNVNQIMKKYRQTGVITHLNAKPGFYADLANLPSYEEALQTVIHGNQAFSTLPSEIRSRFANDPQKFITWISDPKNRAEAIQFGLIVEPKKQTTLDDINQTLKQNTSTQPKTKTQNDDNSKSE